MHFWFSTILQAGYCIRTPWGGSFVPQGVRTVRPPALNMPPLRYLIFAASFTSLFQHAGSAQVCNQCSPEWFSCRHSFSHAETFIAGKHREGQGIRFSLVECGEDVVCKLDLGNGLVTGGCGADPESHDALICTVGPVCSFSSRSASCFGSS